MTPTLRDLAATAKRARKETARRDDLIRQAHAEGQSLRAIGEAAGMTAPGIRRVIDRGEK